MRPFLIVLIVSVAACSGRTGRGTNGPGDTGGDRDSRADGNLDDVGTTPDAPGTTDGSPDAPPPPPPGSPRDSASILFIGHSLVNHDMPLMVAAIAESMGVNHDVAEQVINGAPLRANWDESSGAEGVDGRAVLPTGRFDVVVMTEALPLGTNVEYNEPHLYAGNFLDLARGGNPSAIAYIYETWHEYTLSDFRSKLDSDFPVWLSIADRMEAARPGQTVFVVPAGQAMAALYDRIAAGTMPGLSNISDVFRDDIHMNDAGNYFVGLVQFATIYRRSPVGATTDVRGEFGETYATPNAATAQAMQELAWDTVLRVPRAGVAAR